MPETYFNQSIVKLLREQAYNLVNGCVSSETGIKPEDTLYWRAADEIERLRERAMWDQRGVIE